LTLSATTLLRTGPSPFGEQFGSSGCWFLYLLGLRHHGDGYDVVVLLIQRMGDWQLASSIYLTFSLFHSIAGLGPPAND